MSGRYVITCDLCGKEITNKDVHRFMIMPEFDPLKGWVVSEELEKDMCESCFSIFQGLVKIEELRREFLKLCEVSKYGEEQSI